MSIVVTKRGDAGQTDLLFGRQLPKTSILLDVLGDLDEVKVLLGFVRLQPDVKTQVTHTAEILQDRIVELSGRMCVHHSDQGKYMSSKLKKFVLDHAIETIEQRAAFFEGELDWDNTWSTPGQDAASTYLEQARVIARRAERNFIRWIKSLTGDTFYTLEFEKVARIWLNRLSDLLWLMAQYQTK